jgi:hypothetical protein
LDRTSEDENFLKRTTKGDEIWVYGYDVEMKMQYSQWVVKNSQTEKRVAGQVEHEDHADGFF